MMTKVPVQSAGGIVYFIDNLDLEPRFLLIKRFALSKKVEWVAPKGKINKGETSEQAAIREIYEEVGMEKEKLKLKEMLGNVTLSLHNDDKGTFDKEITYFLVEYKGDPNSLKIIDGEGYLGYYKWAKIEEVLGLIYYENLRELFRKAFTLIKHQ